MQTYSEKQVQEMISEVDSAIETLLKSEKDALVALQKGSSAGFDHVMANAAKGAAAAKKAEGSYSESSSSSSSKSPMGKGEESASASASKSGSVSVPETSASANGGLGKGEAPSELDRTAKDQLAKGAAPSELDRTAKDQLRKDGEDASASPVAESSASSAPSASPSASPDASTAPDDSSASPDAGQAPSEQELVEAYGQLSQPELELHAKALAQVMAAQAGAQSPSASPAGPPAPGSSPLPGDQSPGVAPDAMAAMKSENSLLRGQVEELQKGMSAFVDGFKDLLAPKQKAVTALDVVPASKPSLMQLTKSEIGDRMPALVKREDLTKADRKLITAWYRGDASDQDIAHLLSK